MLAQPQPQNIPHNDLSITDPQETPTDSVSCISWTPSGKNPTFATSAWDSFIRIYNVDSEASSLEQKSCFEADSPCLSVNWHEDETTLFAGCTDGSARSFDVETGQSEVIGHHEGPVRSVYWLSQPNALLTLSYDRTLRFWDPRQEGSKHVAGFKLDYKPFCSDLIYPNLVVGMSETAILYLNLLDIQSSLIPGSPYYMVSPLGKKSQLTSIKLCQGEQPAIGMSDNHGRCNISKFKYNDGVHGPLIDLNSVITWKSHHKRDLDKRTIEVYPNTSFGFHPNHGSNFVYTTGAGGEGQMNFWDIKRKDKIAEFDFKGTSVTRAEMDPTGKFLAYALGYDWSRGIQGYMSQAPKVCVHVMKDQELDSQKNENPDFPIRYD